jgi:hypothetical protein
MASRKRQIAKLQNEVESKNVPADGWPRITQGSHLTVKTFEDGKTELIWDDDALLRDVRAALAKSNIP